MYSICSEGLGYEVPMGLCRVLFLNQIRAGHRPVRAWFLKIVSVRSSVCVCVCPPPRLLMTSGVMWYDMNLIQLVKQVLQLLYATVVIIVNWCGLDIGTYCRH